MNWNTTVPLMQIYVYSNVKKCCKCLPPLASQTVTIFSSSVVSKSINSFPSVKLPAIVILPNFMQNMYYY